MRRLPRCNNQTCVKCTKWTNLMAQAHLIDALDLNSVGLHFNASNMKANSNTLNCF